VLSEHNGLFQTHSSQRQRAEALGIPRTTLQHWLERKDSIDADPALIEFFESPVGAAFLHRMVVATHVLTLIGPVGIRLVCQFLELTGLDKFVASSLSAQHKVSVQMQEEATAFGKQEQARLAEGMEQKQITVCQDETFHPETCLVAIEPVSNYILLEKYAPGRKSRDWTTSMQKAVEGLPIEIVQSVSDEGTGILHHVKQELGAHHSPDVFHVQHEIIKGTGGALAAQTRRASESLEDASSHVSRLIGEKEAYLGAEHGPGRPPCFDARIEKARNEEETARRDLETATARQERVKKAVHGIGDVYHPVDLETGEMKTAEAVSSSLNACFSEIETASAEAGLSERCLTRIKKAKKVVVSMVATIAFYLFTIQAKVEALSLAPEVEAAVLGKLIPALYIRIASKKAKSAVERARLREKAEALLLPLRSPDGPFSGIDPAEKELIERISEECVHLFQRSSSCVEGRNGQLSLRHHSLHRISDRKLSALTVAHNYFVKRSDRTTAAERFFGAKPNDLFKYLLNRVEIPGWPARKRLLGGSKPEWPKGRT